MVDLLCPADSWDPGVVPAQDASWAAVGKTDMSAPVSAIKTSATPVLTPGMLLKSFRTRLRACE